MSDFKSVQITKNPSNGAFLITFKIKTEKSGRYVLKRFKYSTSCLGEKNKTKINEKTLENALLEVLNQQNVADLSTSKIKKMVVSEMKKKKGNAAGAGEENQERREPPLPPADPPPAEENEGGGRGEQDVPLTSAFKHSVFAPEETGNTKVFLAPSFSGKTTLLVNELNRLSEENLKEYDKIILFTESVASAPLKHLKKHVLDKILIYDRFVPKILKLFKRINTVTRNRFKFLIMMDDCIALRGSDVQKMILTLRNVNISTVICIQYSKLLAPSQRQSIHDYFIMNLRLEDLEYILSGFIGSHFREKLAEEGDSAAMSDRIQVLAEKARNRLKDRILHFDQRHDQIHIYLREELKKGKEKEKKGDVHVTLGTVQNQTLQK